MNRNETTDLIDRYLYAVGEELPRAQRGDITKELRTLIEDKLEERARGQRSLPDAAVTAAVLQEIGEPGAVAWRYDPRPQYLIGPRFYPTFLRIVKIGLAGVAFVVVLTTLLSSASASGGSAPAFGLATLWAMLGRYFQIAISLFAWVVLVLAILERTHSRRQPPSRLWDARDLPAVPRVEEDRVSAPGLAVEICLVLFLLVVVNFIPQWVGVLMVRSGRAPEFVPLAAFGVHLPLLAIDLWLGVALGLKLTVLGQRRWTSLTRWLEVAVGVLAAAVLFLIAARSTLHGPAGLPQLDPALRLLGRLLYVAPFAVFLQPLRRTIRLVRAPQPETTSGR
jgi:hypothetical protein